MRFSSVISLPPQIPMLKDTGKMGDMSEPLKIAIASGKGGTGKTTVSVSLAHALSARSSVTLIDCDVEEPNAHLLADIEFDRCIVGQVDGVKVDSGKCTGCGKCAEACRFNAIAVLPSGVMLFEELCHSCMGCVLACQEKCFQETQRRMGEVRFGHRGGLKLVSGLLDVGQAMAAGLIEVVCGYDQGAEIVILDSPPGTNCAMLAAVGGCDRVILVTEPTPFGLNDLKLAVDSLRHISKPFDVVVNRNVEGVDIVENYCQSQGIEILTRIPDDLEVAKLYSDGTVPYGNSKCFTDAVDMLVEKLNLGVVNR